MKTAIFVYELGQIRALMSFLSSIESDRESYTVIALGANIELVLEEKNIPFQSGRGLRSVEHIDFMTYVEKLGRDVLDDPSLSFFHYRGVKLTDVFMPILQSYLLTILFFVDVFSTLVKTYPEYQRIVVFPTSDVLLETAGVLAPLGARAAVDAARILGVHHGVEIIVPTLRDLEPSARILTRIRAMFFYAKRWLFGVGLAAVNLTITISRPAKEIRILASDYWKHISPLMNELPEGEVLLLDRTELFKAGLAAVWRYRMRFIHIDSFVTRVHRKNIEKQIEIFVSEWQASKGTNQIVQNAQFKGMSIASVIEVTLHTILTKGAKQALLTIDGAYALYEKMRPDIVLVRASVSGQIHFPILCLVAKQKGVPSLEIQHGIFYLGQGSFINRPAAEYVATYGPLASEGLKKLEYSDEKLYNIGSPRFDMYQALREKSDPTALKSNSFTIACIVPAVLPQSWSDSYEVMDFFANMATAVADIPNCVVLFKLRGIRDNEDFLRRAVARAFGEIPYRIAQYEPLVDVYAQSDAIVTIYSTTLLEGLISGRPVIYNGTLVMHDAIGKEFLQYAEAGALIKVKTPQELKTALESFARDPQLRATQVEKANAFMKQHYSFDGIASKQLADTIRSLVARKQVN